MAVSERWKDLRIGIVATVAVVAAAACVLLFARVGALRGETFRIMVRVGAARGLMKGSDVWLGGQKVGKVADISFMPPSRTSEDPLVIAVDVLEEHHHAIRRDSPVSIRAGGRLIAAPVVSISPGTSGSPVVRQGDTLRATGQADLQSMAARFGDATRELPAVMNDVKRVGQQLRNPGGTIGAFGSERGSVELAAVRARGSRLAASLGQRRGSLGRLLNGRGALFARANTVLARVDSIQQLLDSPTSALGRFRRDSTLSRELEDIQSELSIVRTLIAQSQGTAGRIVNDGAISEALMEAEREVGAIMADIRRRPFRYLNF